MNTSILCFVLLLMLPPAAAAQKETRSRPPIIDVHMHVYEKDERWDKKTANPLTGAPMQATSEQAHMQATMAEMKKYNIVGGVVSGHYPAALRWKSAAPDQFIVSYGFDDPSQLDTEFVRREHAAGRLLSFGEIGAQYLGIAPNDKRMDAFFRLAEELDVPVGIHIGLSKPGIICDVEPRYRAAIGDPLLLEEVLVRYPKVRVYVMHAGWPMTDHMIALMWAHPPVYVDVAVINWALPRREFHACLRRLVDAGFGKRIMFGSDQMVWPETIGAAVEGIESAAFLNEEQKRDIFYNNAVRFFRLDNK